MRTLTIIATLSLLSLLACKNSSQAMDSDRIEPSNQKKSTKHVEQDVIYDMVITFASFGTGIDDEAKNKVDQIIASFNKDNKTAINPEKVRWGREGEIDYHFTLKNLSTSQKESFIALIKEGIGSSERTKISFDKKSVHKR